MKAMVLDSYFCLCAGKVCDKLRNVVGLIVEHHSKNVEAKAGVGMLKASRFVNEYTQFLHVHTLYKEKVAGITSSHLREDFPPHPDDPPFQKDLHILYHIGLWDTRGRKLEFTHFLTGLNQRRQKVRRPPAVFR